jgi:hypothetical protein
VRDLPDSVSGIKAALYSMQVANPRPDVEIQSIGVVRTSPRAVPAIPGITLGKIVEK